MRCSSTELEKTSHLSISCRYLSRVRWRFASIKRLYEQLYQWFKINKTDMGSIFEDTLKSPTGKWSRKSLTMLTSFGISIVLGAYIVVSDYLLDEEVNRYAIEVFNAFMILTGTLSGVTVLDKKFESKEKTEPEV